LADRGGILGDLLVLGAVGTTEHDAKRRVREPLAFLFSGFEGAKKLKLVLMKNCRLKSGLDWAKIPDNF